MKFLTEPRFWISVLAIGAVTALAILGKLGGEAVIAFIGGILLRFGVAPVKQVQR